MGKLDVIFAIYCIMETVYGAPSGQAALSYLSQYGYLATNHNSNASAIVDLSTFSKGIEEFQSFAGLEVTGKLDDATLKEMSLPRCGVKDKEGSSSNRAKRYALQGSRWKVRDLKFKVTKYPVNLKQHDVDRTVQDAFNVWSGYTDLTFSPGSGRVHIDIRFERGEHGDGDPFDGPGGTLAHAYFPVFGGDAHFDASERWTVDSYAGTNLFQVAAHEFGHSLGLSHSDVREALMAPFYRGYEPIFQLHEDDITGIQRLYGEKTKKSRPSYDDEDGYETRTKGTKEPAPPRKPQDKDLCDSSKIDVIFTTSEGNTYVFKDDRYWRLTEDSVAPGYPKIISAGWPGLPGNMDAAFTYKNGKTYFFKGDKYWRYKGRKVDGVYPKLISEGFTGIPDDVDAALVWSGNGKIYFFKGSKFWRFDPSARPPVKSMYPKPISNWEGVPDNVDAAFQWTNGYTYFVKNQGYYRFDDRAFSVARADPAFPRSAAYWWFGCEAAPRGSIGTSYSRNWYINEESDSDSDGDGNKLHHDTGDSIKEEGSPCSTALCSDNGDNGAGPIKSPSVLLTILVSLLITKLSCSVS